MLFMRVIAKSTLVAFWTRHPETETALQRWHAVVKAADWGSTQDVLRTFPKAKAIDAQRIRFAVHGGDYRMIVAFDFVRQIAFVKFIGKHGDYDRVDATRISLF
jgi:mRNA interferase HigB